MFQRSAIRLALLSCLTFILPACEPHYTLKQSQKLLQGTRVVDSYRIDRQQGFALSTRAHFYIANNASEDNSLVKLLITRHLHDALSSQFDAVLLGMGDEGFGEALQSARSLKTDYLVYPTVQIWNDHTKVWQDYRYSVPTQAMILRPPVNKGERLKHEGSHIVVKREDLSGELRVLLKIIDVRSGHQVENVVVTTAPGVFYNENKRPLDFLHKPFAELARALAGVKSG